MFLQYQASTLNLLYQYNIIISLRLLQHIHPSYPNLTRLQCELMIFGDFSLQKGGQMKLNELLPSMKIDKFALARDCPGFCPHTTTTLLEFKAYFFLLNLSCWRLCVWGRGFFLPDWNISATCDPVSHLTHQPDITAPHQNFHKLKSWFEL